MWGVEKDRGIVSVYITCHRSSFQHSYESQERQWHLSFLESCRVNVVFSSSFLSPLKRERILPNHLLIYSRNFTSLTMSLIGSTCYDPVFYEPGNESEARESTDGKSA